MVIPQYLLAQKGFTDDLRRLLSLTPEQLRMVTERMEAGSLEPLAEMIGLIPNLQESILPMVSFLYQRARSENVTSEEAIGELQSSAVELNMSISEQHVAGLRALFNPKPLLDQKDSVNSARGRVLPTLDSVRTTHELRNVADIRSNEPLGVIPVVTLGLEISYPNRDERSISVELDEQSLKGLSDSLEKAAQELNKLKERATPSLTIL